jgi:hypothetical protein
LKVKICDYIYLKIPKCFVRVELEIIDGPNAGTHQISIMREEKFGQIYDAAKEAYDYEIFAGNDFDSASQQKQPALSKTRSRKAK